MYRIDVQYEINVQVGKFSKNIKRAGQNRRAGGKLSGKSINVQGEKFLEIESNSKSKSIQDIFGYLFPPYPLKRHFFDIL